MLLGVKVAEAADGGGVDALELAEASLHSGEESFFPCLVALGADASGDGDGHWLVRRRRIRLAT